MRIEIPGKMLDKGKVDFTWKIMGMSGQEGDF